MGNTTLSDISSEQILILKKIALAITGKNSVSALVRAIADHGRMHQLNPTTGYTELIVTNRIPPSQDLHLIERDLISTHYEPPDSPEVDDKWIGIIDKQPELEVEVQLFHSSLGAGTGQLYVCTPLSLNGIKNSPRLYWRFQANGSLAALDLPFTDAIITHWSPFPTKIP